MLPNDTETTDRQLLEYLLGLLPSKDANRFDEASIVDDEFAGRLRAAEDDLVDAYVRGQLDEQTRRRFESYYLASAAHWSRVQSAAAFTRAVDDAAGRAPRGAFTQWARATMLPLLALAAALLLVVCGVLAVQNRQLIRALTVAQSERAAIDRRARDVEQELSQVRSTSPAAAPEPSRPPSPRVPREVPIALVLVPTTRATGPVPAVAVPRGADRVRVELPLDTNDFPAYQVSLRDPSVNGVVWRSGWIAASSSAGRASVAVSIPARALKPQHYSLDLGGRAASGAIEVVGSYAIEVHTR